MKVVWRHLVRGKPKTLSRELVLTLGEARLVKEHLSRAIAVLDGNPKYDSVDAMGVATWALKVEREPS